MKIIKYIFLLLLLIAVAVSVFIATQESKFKYESEKLVNVPKDILYNYINDYNNWASVGLFTTKNDSINYNFSENTIGEGSFITWKENNTQKRFETLNVFNNDSIVQRGIMNDLNAVISWHFKDTIGGTKILMSVKGEKNFIDKARSLFMGSTTADFSSDNNIQKIERFLVHELGTFSIDDKGVVNKKGTYYLKQHIAEELNSPKIVNEKIAAILAFSKQNKIDVTGAPFTLHMKNDSIPGKKDFFVCIPIKEEIFTSPDSEYIGGILQPVQALQTTLNGDYSHLEKAIQKGRVNFRNNNLTESSEIKYIISYTKNRLQTNKPSQWITDIYMPIMPKQEPQSTSAASVSIKKAVIQNNSPE